MTKKKFMKCPVCGKFANEKQVEKYDELVKERDSLKSELADYKKAKDKLVYINMNLNKMYDDLMSENIRLRKRGFWSRVLNL